jgi:hypothetical protein
VSPPSSSSKLVRKLSRVEVVGLSRQASSLKEEDIIELESLLFLGAKI